MHTYGLLGWPLAQSFSQDIHQRLADYSYAYFEVPPDSFAEFLTQRSFRAMNVTIPYKEAVIPYLEGMDEGARACGAVNVVVNREGKLYGYNTDVLGMEEGLRRAGFSLAGKSALILGTGGTSKTAAYVLAKLGARRVRKVSRTGREGALTYEQALDLDKDVDFLINTSPVGMAPDPMDRLAIPPSAFSKLEGIYDVVYNPLRTPLVIQGEKEGIPSVGGLYMLALQAFYAARLFLGQDLDRTKADRVFQDLMAEKRNIVLTGMPASGKTTVGRFLAWKMGRKLVDTDRVIEDRTGRHVSEILLEEGEEALRDREAKVISDLRLETGLVISTGGGAILREENRDALRANGLVYFLDRPVGELFSTYRRPLTPNRRAMEDRYRERVDLYRQADVHLDIRSMESDRVAEKIMADWPRQCLMGGGYDH